MKKKLKIFIIYWLPVFVWALVIFSFSSKPTATVSEVFIEDFVAKKFAHLVEYGFFALLIYRALKNSGLSKNKSGLLAVIVASIYGVTDEFHQSFTPGRTPTVRDAIIDTIGACLTIYLVRNGMDVMPKIVKDLAKRFELI